MPRSRRADPSPDGDARRPQGRRRGPADPARLPGLRDLPHPAATVSGVSRFLEHRSRAARWRADTFQVLPEAVTADQTVWFAVDPGVAEDREDAVWEGLLTRPVAPDRAVVVAVPVFAYDAGRTHRRHRRCRTL